MPDPFASALDVLHAGPCAEAATFLPGGSGPGTSISVVRSQPDTTISGVGSHGYVAATNQFDVRRTEVAAPKAGDVIQIATGPFEIEGTPMLDAEGLTWRCGAEPIA